MSRIQTSVAEPSAPVPPRQARVLLALMCSALALVIAANVSLNVSLPALGRDLGASQSQLTWMINGYTLPFAALLLPAGALSDRIGQRTAVCVGLVVFGLSSIVSAFLPSAPLIIVLRVVAALGATLVMPATLSVLTRAYPEERRAQAVATWAAVSGAGTVLGLLLGGLFMQLFWWGSVLVLTGALSLVVSALCYVSVPQYRLPGSGTRDLPGAVLSALALGLFVYALMQGAESGWASPFIVTSLLTSVVLAVVFVVWELRTPVPLIDVRLFRSPTLAVGSGSVLLQFAATLGLFLLLPQMLQDVRGYSPLQSALSLLPLPGGIAAGGQLAARLQQRLGNRIAVAAGMAVAAAAFVALGLQSQTAAFPSLGFALAFFGLGFGLATTPATSMVLDGMPSEAKTMASALNDALREVGGALGIALLGAALNTAYRARAGTTGGLVGDDAAGVTSSFSSAAEVARRVGGSRGAEIVADAQQAFYAGYQVAAGVAALLLAVAAVLAWVVAPRRQGSTRRDEHTPDRDAHASPSSS